MSARPTPTPIYHITHVDNLPSILSDDALLSDSEMIACGGPAMAVGMSTIKQRRLELPVKCHPGDCVGDYVPFYFCPRSIMLYLLHMGNHPELTYRGGQGPILHLEADLDATVTWAEASGMRWGFSLSNAGARYAEFRSRVEQLDEVDWAAVANPDFRSSEVKEGKQAEFSSGDSSHGDSSSASGSSTLESRAVCSLRSKALPVSHPLTSSPLVLLRSRDRVREGRHPWIRC